MSRACCRVHRWQAFNGMVNQCGTFFRAGCEIVDFRTEMNLLQYKQMADEPQKITSMLSGGRLLIKGFYRMAGNPVIISGLNQMASIAA